MWCRHCWGRHTLPRQVKEIVKERLEAAVITASTVLSGRLEAAVITASTMLSREGNAGQLMAARRLKSLDASNAGRQICSHLLKLSLKIVPRLGSRRRGFRRGPRNGHARHENVEVLRPRACRCSEEEPRRAAPPRGDSEATRLSGYILTIAPMLM